MIPLPFIPCIFIGDSTANGAAMAYNASAARPCLVVARDGASPSAIAQSEIPGGAIGTAVIGAGTNDPLSPSLVSNLYATRRRISTYSKLAVACRWVSNMAAICSTCRRPASRARA